MRSRRINIHAGQSQVEVMDRTWATVAIVAIVAIVAVVCMVANKSFGQNVTNVSSGIKIWSGMMLSTTPSAEGGGSVTLINGGFETGDWTGWTPENDSNSGMFQNYSSHSGAYSAELSAPSYSPVSISQTISTTIGQHYALSFWAKRASYTPCQITLDWEGSTGTQPLTISDSTGLGTGYTQYNYIVGATNSSTVLKFSAIDLGDFIDLDDITMTTTSATIP
jgi:hypothetical protein